jgi:hypothetical protein
MMLDRDEDDQGDVDQGDVLQGPSRARNKSALPWVGDPERWGGRETLKVDLNPAGSTPPVFGQTIIRGQTQDLCAVGWDLVATWEVEGFVTATDTIQIVWRVTVGTGQATSILGWSLGSLSPAGNVPNPQAVALGWVPINGSNRAGVALSGQPIIACALSAQPVVIASTTGGAHSLRVSCTGHCAPRGWVP